MTYTVAVGVALCVCVVLDCWLLRTRLLCGRFFWATYPIMLFFQLLANGILTARGIVRYSPEAINGWRIAYAPIEDLGFGFALVLTTLSVWTFLGQRESGERGE